MAKVIQQIPVGPVFCSWVLDRINPADTADKNQESPEALAFIQNSPYIWQIQVKSTKHQPFSSMVISEKPVITFW